MDYFVMIELLKKSTECAKDPRGPFFLTQWEREDYERKQRGEPERGPADRSTD
jgi:hypothetical protein